MTHDNGTTFRYTQEEARLADAELRRGERPFVRMPVRLRNGGRQALPMAVVSPEQARAAGWQFLERLTDLVNVLSERGLLTDLVVARAWVAARSEVRMASEINAAVAAANPADGSDAAAGVGKTTAAVAE